MPSVYLSPSTQEYNPYITGNGSEEYFMNLIADAMIPYLQASGIQYGRNTPEMTAASSIAQANRGNYDFYLALHSNASGPGNEGAARGIIAFYYPTSSNGRRGAEIFAENLRQIYPLPNRVTTRATTALGEVRQPNAPAVLIEIGYHDNINDARWIEGNINLIAQNLVMSLAEYFGIPFVYPGPASRGRVTTQSGALNLRDYPSMAGNVIAQIPNGTEVSVYGQYENWYVVQYGRQTGYASADYIQLI
ncbi:MAG: N-acetylmuramoyl-L-alanine amidase [Clostridiales bacterium]|nr:N-acetylmuramoyl-L-alanine amidase [Candidatus Cacconaster stercorequi]